VSPSLRKVVVLAVLAGSLAGSAFSAKKKKEEETQILQLPRELPAAVAGETRRLSFYVTPLSAKGLLSQQVRDALKNLERQAAGNPVLHIRAFVAGTGDLRRVRELVSETFTERHQPLPALSLIQAGSLSLAGAQVVLEAVINGKKDQYPGGIAFFSAQPEFAAQSPDGTLPPVSPLLDHAMTSLKASLASANLAPADVLRLSCFFSSLVQMDDARARIQADFSRAAVDYIQTERAPQRAVATCEAVAGLKQPAPTRFDTRDSHAALIGSEHILFTGTQVSFGAQDQDTRLAFERLGRTLEPLGASLGDVAFARLYPLSGRIEQQVLRLMPTFFNKTTPPVLAALEYEGVAAADAAFAVDAVAVK
jgi:enamine deaminase RidA (YjgF/YER057c/UK114 family)